MKSAISEVVSDPIKNSIGWKLINNILIHLRQFLTSSSDAD